METLFFSITINDNENIGRGRALGEVVSGWMAGSMGEGLWFGCSDRMDLVTRLCEFVMPKEMEERSGMVVVMWRILVRLPAVFCGL